MQTGYLRSYLRTGWRGDAVSLPPCPRDDCTATGHHYHLLAAYTSASYEVVEHRGRHNCNVAGNAAPGLAFTRCYSPHVKADTPDPRLHVLARRLPDWPTDDLADLLAELDTAVTL